MTSLSELHDSEKLLLTAHRGASFDDAENTTAAFDHAVRSGADFIEFDLRMSSDGIPVVLHDPTIDRTSNGHGKPEEHTFSELRKFNFSFWHHGMRHETPLYPEMPIPSFEEILKQFRGKACMNIQVYADPAGLDEICRLYLKYGMQDQGYLTIESMETANQVRKYSPEIEICLTPGWHDRAKPENLKLCREFGCRFVQPTVQSVSGEMFRLCRELGLRPNIFFSDDPAQVRLLQKDGASGFLTNRIDLLASELGR